MDKLPPMEFTFDLNKKGSDTQKVYTGSFTYRRLSIGNQGKAGVLKAQLNGDLANVGQDVDQLHEMISWLRFGIVDYPEWWRESNFGIDLYDGNIVKEIYSLVSDFEKKWIEKVKLNDKSHSESSVK